MEREYVTEMVRGRRGIGFLISNRLERNPLVAVRHCGKLGVLVVGSVWVVVTWVGDLAEIVVL